MKKLVLLFTISLFFTCLVNAQMKIDLSKEIPIDEKVKIGKLENGLTYYIRKNVKPENRAEFFLVVDAGAILEDDDQDGLAHFCEHMAFNGTKNFKKHEIINYLQSIGMKFGPEINAFTNHDVTNYMLQKVPTIPEENIDTALLILHDWASAVSYENEEIDNERGVIHEEWRTRRGAGYRMSIETDKVLLDGSKYAKRNVLGNIDVIDNASYDAFTRFYNDWYRPDLQAIIAIGDFEVEDMEKKIIKMFSKIEKRTDVKERKNFDIPDHDDLRISIETDEEARNTNVKVIYKHDPVKDKSRQQYLFDQIKNRLFSSMLNNRLSEYTSKPDAAFSYGFAYYSSLRRTKDAFTTTTYARNNKAAESLEIIFREHKRVLKFGFTKNEFETARKEVMKWYEKAYKERDKVESSRLTWNYFSHFLSDNPIPGVEFSYQFASAALEKITLEEVNALGGKCIQDKNKVVIITGPETEGVTYPSKKEVVAIIEKINKEQCTPYEDVVLEKPLLEEDPKGGGIVTEVYKKELEAYEFSLSNGAKVIFKQTDFKEDEILFSAYSFGGSSLYDEEHDLAATYAPGISNESGLGAYNKTQLKKYLGGKIVNYRAFIGETIEGLSGSTRPEDFETAMQMLYLMFTKPGFSEEGYRVYIDKEKTWLENKELDPENALWDEISLVLSQNHPRRKPVTAEDLEDIDYEKAKEIFKERFAGGREFTFVFVGNVDKEQLMKMVSKYIGAIPPSDKAEKYIDLEIRYPKGQIAKVIEKEMKVPKSTVYIAYTGDVKYNLENKVKLDALSDILDVRYTETIREEQGGTYGVSVYAWQSKYPHEDYRLNIMFDCDPDKAEKLKGIAYDEIEKLQVDGPEQKYLDNFKKNKIKEHEEKLKQNKYWLKNIKSMYLNDVSNIDASYIKIINSLTIDDIQEAAGNLLNDENHAEFILKPVK